MNTALPTFLKICFWDCDFASLTMEEHSDFIIRRLLHAGSWDAITWLRAEIGDEALRRWLEQHRGAGLAPRKLRLWEVVIGLPRSKVTRWVHAAASRPWEERLPR